MVLVFLFFVMVAIMIVIMLVTRGVPFRVASLLTLVIPCVLEQASSTMIQGFVTIDNARAVRARGIIT